ncbi:MAG: phosphoribosylamine--glycine ligase [Vicingaceae bacterium]
MNALVIGSGGREHALTWKIVQSPLVDNVFVALGNAGTGQLGVNLNVNVDDFPGIESAILDNDVGLVIIGPEDPLVNGLTDRLRSDHRFKDLLIVGPSSKAAMLEGSKEFAKAFMARHGIPTAAYKSFGVNDLESGFEFLETLSPPYVLKADGLAAGKGVLILNELAEAKQELKAMLGGKFGQASSKVVIEEFLDGIEMSVFVLTDGKDYVMLPEAKDYKRIGEGDKGLNTGGMGAVSPVPFAQGAFMKKVEERIVKTTIKGLAAEGFDYRGFVFFGLIKVGDDPFVIEYNVRMGDPETEVVIPRIKSDLVPMLEACARGKLLGMKCDFDPRVAVTIMLVSGGYPESYEKGKEITGLEVQTDSILFHAGTKNENGRILTSGGRVLSITSLADTMDQALAQSYEQSEKVNYDQKYYRKDIGFDL